MINNKACKILVMSTAFLLVVVCLSFARTDHREYRGAKPAECRDCHSGAGVGAIMAPFSSTNTDYWHERRPAIARIAISNRSVSTATRAGTSNRFAEEPVEKQGSPCRRRIGRTSSPSTRLRRRITSRLLSLPRVEFLLRLPYPGDSAEPGRMTIKPHQPDFYFAGVPRPDLGFRSFRGCAEEPAVLPGMPSAEG